jgi:hypothetical protein
MIYGLSSILKRYHDEIANPKSSSSSSSSSLLVPFPDYLLLVDDDTYFNLDLLYQLELQHRNSSIPHVSAGCRHTNGNTITFAYGGFGSLFSKGSLLRLAQTLHCERFGGWWSGDHTTTNTKTNTTTTTTTTTTTGLPVQDLTQIPSRELLEQPNLYQEGVCQTLQKNWILERSFYQPGMSLMDVMTARAFAEPYSSFRPQQQPSNVNATTTTTVTTTTTSTNSTTVYPTKSKSTPTTPTTTNWTIGFCFHSDHYLAILIELYQLSSHPKMDALQESEIVLYRSAQRKSIHRGSCLNERENCNATTALACHYQTPSQFHAHHQEV